MKSLFVTMSMLACIILLGGSSEAKEENPRPSNPDIIAAIQGEWIKTHGIHRTFVNGVEENVQSVGFGYNGPMYKFTLPGTCCQWDYNSRQWGNATPFEIREGEMWDGFLVINNWYQGKVSLYDNDRMMVWVTEEEKQSHGAVFVFRQETHFQRLTK